jgi:hypothetical protein
MGDERIALILRHFAHPPSELAVMWRGHGWTIRPSDGITAEPARTAAEIG